MHNLETIKVQTTKRKAINPRREQDRNGIQHLSILLMAPFVIPTLAGNSIKQLWINTSQNMQDKKELLLQEKDMRELQMLQFDGDVTMLESTMTIADCHVR